MSSKKVEPRVIGMDAWKWSGEDYLVPECHQIVIDYEEGVGKLGLYVMNPGAKTNVFSMEQTDDGTAEEYYGPCHEFYYLLVGECTMYWGEDTAKVKDGTSGKLVLKAGDLGYWAPGWKYSVQNTGKVPETFFWGITSPSGQKRRSIKKPPPGTPGEQLVDINPE